MNALATVPQILRKHYVMILKNIPTHYLKRNTSEIQPLVQHISGGKYYHFGIATLMSENYPGAVHKVRHAPGEEEV
jgi:hypothetical protein